MRPNQPQQRPSDVEIDATMQCLREQRNGAEDMVATLAGRIGLLTQQMRDQQAVIAALQAKVLELEAPPEIPPDASPPGTP